MLTQIYEVTDAETASAVSRIGVDHVGAKVGDGSRPRELTVAEARVVMAAVTAPSKFSALFLDSHMDRICAWIAALAPPIVHLGADVDRLLVGHVALIRQRFPNILVMRSIPVVGEESLAIARDHDRFVDFLMLDSVRPGDRKFGALGVTHDWGISRRIVEAVSCPVLLAGGLGPDNVAEAIATVRPAGVDSKTRTDVEGGHAKALDKVRRYHQAAKAAFALQP
jgi:phosphoribosylanthranilate isomerase